VAKAEPTIGEYTPAGYPKANPKFRAEADKLLERGREAREAYEKYVREWTTKLRAQLKTPQR
jgi:hypothetical protein